MNYFALSILRNQEAFRLRRFSSRQEYVFNQRRTFTLKGDHRRAHIRGRVDFFLGESNLKRDILTRNLFLENNQSLPIELACELCAPLNRIRATPEEVASALEDSLLLQAKDGSIVYRGKYQGPTKPLDFRDDCSFVRNFDSRPGFLRTKTKLVI